MAKAVPLKLQRCTNHAEREAAVRCPVCHKHFCRECITEHHGKMLCVNCLRTRNEKKSARNRVFSSAMEALCMCVVLFIIFWCFSYMGRRLVQSGGKPLSKVSTEAVKGSAIEHLNPQPSDDILVP